MFSITELPRVDGVIVGDFLAKHSSSSFSLESFGFHFVDGVTKEPVRGRVCDRLQAAYGNDVAFIAADRASADMAIAWMVAHSMPEQRITRLRGELDALFPVARKVVEVTPAAQELGPVHAHRDSTPPPSVFKDFDTDHETPSSKKRQR